MRHGVLYRINEKGVEGRWQCQRCKAEGTTGELAKVQCTDPRPATDDELLDAIDPSRRQPRQ